MCITVSLRLLSLSIELLTVTSNCCDIEIPLQRSHICEHSLLLPLDDVVCIHPVVLGSLLKVSLEDNATIHSLHPLLILGKAKEFACGVVVVLHWFLWTSSFLLVQLPLTLPSLVVLALVHKTCYLNRENCVSTWAFLPGLDAYMGDRMDELSDVLGF